MNRVENPYASRKKIEIRAAAVPSGGGYGHVTILKPCPETGKLVPIKTINPDTGKTIKRHRKG